MKRQFVRATLSIIVSGLITVPAFAETLAYNITRMHCGACKASVEKAVCKDKATNAAVYAKCEVKLTDHEKEMGELIIETKPGQKAEPAVIAAAIEKLGYKPELKTTSAKK